MIILTKQEAIKFIEIIRSVEEAYVAVSKATRDLESDLEKIFGTPEHPEYAPEDHIHIGGTICNIKLNKGKIQIFCDEWVNTFGEPICMEFTSYVKDPDGPGSIPSVYWIRPTKFRELFKNRYSVRVEVNKSYYYEYSPRVEELKRKIIRWLLDNFKYKKVIQNTNWYLHNEADKEFGFALDLDNYYKDYKGEK